MGASGNGYTGCGKKRRNLNEHPPKYLGTWINKTYGQRAYLRLRGKERAYRIGGAASSGKKRGLP